MNNNPFLIFENLYTTPRRQLFVLLGTPWRVTRLGWLLLPAYFLPGFLLGFLLLPGATASGVRVAAGVLAGMALLLTTLLHEVGHILSARWVGAPVTEIYLAAIRPLTRYNGLPFFSLRVSITQRQASVKAKSPFPLWQD